MTYSEMLLRKPFDWRAFLQQEKYESWDVITAVHYSSKWVTCACGNQCSRIPRELTGCPTDRKLARLGAAFHDVVVSLRYAVTAPRPFEKWQTEALRILDQIEARSEEILKEMEAADAG